MFSSEDFERFLIKYKAEGLPRKQCIREFCSKNNVPYGPFIKWYEDTRHKIVPVSVEGRPGQEQEENLLWDEPHMVQPTVQKPAWKTPRILVTIRSTSGLKISKGNLDYEGLCKFVENLRGLC